MPTSSLARKLLIKSGQRVAVFNAPPGYLDQLDLPPGTVVAADPIDGEFEMVHLFAHDVAELDRLAPRAIRFSKPDGLLWISYPKQSSKRKSDLTRDVGWSSVNAAGLVGVSLISIDDVWSAMRFRPAERYVSDRQPRAAEGDVQ